MKELDWYLQSNLKMRQLRLLAAIDTYRNLTQVAEVSHVTVPAVSKSLVELERGLGITLFSRTPQGLIPTVYGECLVRHARAMLAIIFEARDELKALGSGAEGNVRVGMLSASASALLPRAISMLKRRSPKANVVVIEGTKEQLLPELWQGRIDLFVGRLPPTDANGTFEETKLLEEPLMLVTGRHHPLARLKNLKWSDLAPYPWILPPTGSILRDPLERTLEANDLPLTSNYVETLSIHVLRSHLQESDFIAVMGGTLVLDNKQLFHVLPLSLPRILCATGVLWNRHRGLTPSAELLVSCLEEVADGLMAELHKNLLGAPAAACLADPATVESAGQAPVHETDLNDQQWRQLERHLPSNPRHGHAYAQHRQVINGILWRLRNCAPWRDIPSHYGPWQTCYDRFVRWSASGTWQRLLQVMQAAADASGRADWGSTALDARNLKVRRGPPGAAPKRPAAE